MCCQWMANWIHEKNPLSQHGQLTLFTSMKSIYCSPIDVYTGSFLHIYPKSMRFWIMKSWSHHEILASIKRSVKSSNLRELSTNHLSVLHRKMSILLYPYTSLVGLFLLYLKQYICTSVSVLSTPNPQANRGVKSLTRSEICLGGVTWCNIDLNHHRAVNIQTK